MICSFVEAKLSQKPPYEALSYRWTDPNKETPHLVYCNGFECPIGSNLYAALIRFRLADAPRALWVDQLCIDQAEGPEKAQQLLIMGDIYSKAERVLAWLGLAYDDSDKAMDLFPKLVDRLQALTRDHEKMKMESGNHERNFEDTILVQTVKLLPEMRPNSRRALHKLFQRSIFSRVWTLQEMALGKNTVIVCGDRELPFAVLERFNEGYQTDNIGYWKVAFSLLSDQEGDRDPRDPKRPINTHIHVVWVLKSLDWSAFQSSSVIVLTHLRSLDCSKSNDRIYSVLRFLPPTLAQSLTVGKRKSTEALFIDLATFELTKNHSMDFLSAAGMWQHRRCCPSRKDNQLRPTVKLPTWVPDWTYWSDTHGFWEINRDHIMGGYGTLYKATDLSHGDAQLVILDDTKVLCVQGKILDDVAACVEPFKFPVVSLSLRDVSFPQPVQDMINTQRKEYRGKNEAINYLSSPIEHLQLLIDSCIALAKDCTRYDDDIRRTTACRQTLVGGIFMYGLQSLGGDVSYKAKDEDVNELFTEWDIILEANDDLNRWESGGVDKLFFSRLLGMVKRLQSRRWQWTAYEAMVMCKGRRFFTTSKGFMGLAPDIAQVGDKICLISGCCTPFIIRADGPNFCLVGESYVHGVMDGELMSDITFEDINLV